MTFTWESINWDDTFSKSKNGVGINLKAMGNYVAMRLSTITLLDTIYYCDGGIYRRDEGYVTAYVVKCVNDAGLETGIGATVKEIVLQIKSINWTSEFPFDCRPNIIPVRNGVIVIGGDERLGQDESHISLEPHDREWLITKRLDVEYRPDAPTGEIEELLAQWLDGEESRCLVQIPALAIIQAWGGVYKVAYLLEGQKDAGKSTYCQLITNFFGDGQYSLADLSDLIRHRFAKAQLEGSYINIQDDLPGIPLTQIGKFKDLTGKLNHEVERKGKQPYTAKLSALHLYTCNEPPAVEFVDDDAFWSRWNYLVFTGSFERDPSVAERLTNPEMLSGFLNLILKEIIEIKKDAKRIFRMDSEDVKKLWTMAVDYISQFVNEYCHRDAAGIVPKDELYQSYVGWCEKTGKTAVDKADITRSLARMGVSTAKHTLGGKRVQCYKGITFKEGQITLETKRSWSPLDAERVAMEEFESQPWARGKIIDDKDDDFNDAFDKLNQSVTADLFDANEDDFQYDIGD